MITWQQNEWYTYTLDSQAARLFKDSKENNKVVVLIITAPYPHPFLFMTDFRQHLLNHISTTTTTCKIDVVAAPDLFTLITDRVRDVANAVQFYSPVLESMDEETDGFKIFSPYWMILIIFSLIIFVCCTAPLHTILYLWFKQTSFSRIKSSNVTYRK